MRVNGCANESLHVACANRTFDLFASHSIQREIEKVQLNHNKS